MNKPALVAVILAALATPALGAHSIGVYEDQLAQDCEISDPGGAVTKTFYVVVTNAPIAFGGSVWKLEWDAGMTMTWIGDDSSPYFTVGNAKDGISIAYSPCLGGTFKIDTVTMTSFGTSTPCSRFRLAPHPTQGGPMSLTCGGFSPLPIVPGEGIVNANGTCTCNVAVAPTTWGSVKALYR